MPTPHLAPILRARPLSQLVIRPVDFLWPGRLALGKLALIDGDPGLGKSMVALDLCARLSTGRPFPGDSGDSPIATAANSIVINGEDGDDDTTAPRLRALGADLHRVFVLDQLDEDLTQRLSLPSAADTLDRLLADTAAKLVVIDPIVAFLDPTVQTNSDLSVRQALVCLARLAKKHHCVILMIRHLNKSLGQKALYRGGGSIGFVAACRTAWLVAKDPEHEGRCILAQTKNNLAPPQPSLSFEIIQKGLSWLPGTRPFTANELLAQSGHTAVHAPALDVATDFLQDLLEDGPRESREVWTAAQERKLSPRTLKRAKKKLEITSRTVWAGAIRQSYWLLPGQDLPHSIPADAVVPDLEPWLAPLRQRFPPSTPLDDV
jgi:RecA-family ATPase